MDGVQRSFRQRYEDANLFAATLVGLTVDDAVSLAKDSGYSVLRMDVSTDTALTADLRADRITVTVSASGTIVTSEAG